ncbi:TetR/AcrR family transcriptional regulator [Desulfotalea psychrophila]|uniref:Related to transcription regulator n=1 Tax=Desulfotalea psychrophila (strain LSv54 / DSM 12343) TaxID=177439 RepID=Q6AMJ7_DESPS|nr:TetR/AcrR family transcriptional regulator [Desulfotalea psychrophila]CAG36428.1 related to transcription regulator [Desulfotalea psychrophila LSv54]
MTKKEIIIQAATELFTEKGYRETTTSDIRKKAKVAQGTLFYHFANKEGILLHIFSSIINSQLEAIKFFPSNEGTGMEALIKYAQFCNDLRREEGSTLVFVLPNFVPSLLYQHEETKKIFLEFFDTSIAQVEYLIKRGIEDGSIREMDPHTTAHFFIATSIGIDRHMTLTIAPTPNLFPTYLNFMKKALAPEAT